MRLLKGLSFSLRRAIGIAGPKTKLHVLRIYPRYTLLGLVGTP